MSKITIKDPKTKDVLLIIEDDGTEVVTEKLKEKRKKLLKELSEKKESETKID